MSRYTNLVRELFCIGIKVVEEDLPIKFNSFSSYHDMLIIINISQAKTLKQRHQVLLLELKSFIAGNFNEMKGDKNEHKKGSTKTKSLDD